MSTAAPGDQLAQRIAIQHEIAAVAEGLVLGDDLRAHYDDHERLVHLTEAVGDACADVLHNRTLDLDACLYRVAAEAVAWLEGRAREGAL